MKNRLLQYTRGLIQQSGHALERSELVRTLILALFAFLIAYLSVLGIKPTIPNMEVWQWTFGLWVVIFFIIIAPFLLWLSEKEKVEAFEEAAIPKVEVEELEHTSPKGATGLAEREWQIKVRNVSTSPINDCYVVMKSMINNEGQESDSVGQRFKLSTERPVIIQSYDHAQTFKLAPKATETIAIAGTDERIESSKVIMLYAVRKIASENIKNTIPRNFFPHTLIIQICADNIVNPVEIAYDFYFEDGKLKLKRILPTL